MKKLLKEYGFKSDMQYFEMIVESFINGQIAQAVTQFEAMPHMIQVSFIKATTIGGWESGLSKNHLNYLFESL